MLRNFYVSAILLVVSILAYAQKPASTCAVQWPDLAIQKYELRKTVANIDTKAKDFSIELAAPGLAVLQFTNSKNSKEQVIIAFEFMSPACSLGKPEDLLNNPLLYRVLSYTH
jgi:hypothetical protein